MKAFIIYLSDRTHSVDYSKQMLDQLLSYDLEAELYQGVTGEEAVIKTQQQGRILYPYSIKQTELSKNDIKSFIIPERMNELLSDEYIIKVIKKNKIGTDGGKLSMPGVQGCFYSHYNLWKKCIDLGEPIMIFEDDVKIFRSWTPVEWEDILILSLGKSSFLNEPYQTYLENPSGNPQPMPFRQFSMPGASGYAIKPHAAKRLVRHYKSYFSPADNAINQSLVKLQIHNYIMGRNTLPEEGNVSMTRFKNTI
jgi:GR25 family glycosyltransferase involved in LPS biosynthesis